MGEKRRLAGTVVVVVGCVCVAGGGFGLCRFVEEEEAGYVSGGS